MTYDESKKLCEEMPYLMIRNAWDLTIPEDYDYRYTWLEYNELPSGWREHFKKLCYELKEPLARTGQLNNFCFLQVKEKFNTMRVYTGPTTKEIDSLIHKYEDEAYYICTLCGAPATQVTTGYIASFCDECLEKVKGHAIPIDGAPFNPNERLVSD